MSPAELYWLHDTAATMASVAEIGCLRGRSAFAILQGCPGPVVCVDPWNDPGDHGWQAFNENCGMFPNLTRMRMTSTAAARELAGETFGMTFIDGSHAYESVLIDIANWLPLTRQTLCGHDYSNADGGYPGVGQAVREVFGEERVTVPPGTSIWVVDVRADRTVADGLPTAFDYVDEYDVHYVEEVSW